MSTRANIVLESGESRVYLYRHCDGYPAETGADLVRLLAATGGSASGFLQSLLDQRYEKQSYESAAKRIYELTSEVHGDIEYLYRVRLVSGWENREPLIGFSHHAIGSDRPDNANGVVLGSLRVFCDAVNAEIRAQNVRLEQLKREQPAHFGQCAPAEEVSHA